MSTNPILALFDVGGQEMLLILIVILILFGAKKLPEMARNLGKTVEQFKKAANNVRNEVINADADTHHYNDHARLASSNDVHDAYTDSHAIVDAESQPVSEQKPESKTEVTLNVSPAVPAGTVSQNESHDQVPPQTT